MTEQNKAIEQISQFVDREEAERWKERYLESEAEISRLKQENERLNTRLEIVLKSKERRENDLASKEKECEELRGLIKDYEEVSQDKKRLVRELDVLMNGKNAAKQASLCDIVSMAKEWFTLDEIEQVVNNADFLFYNMRVSLMEVFKSKKEGKQ